MPVILRFQSTGTVPGNARPVTMLGPSLTIGRGDENDLVLPDPDKLISKRHCVIEDQGGNVIVIDFSTNGTFLNYGKVPLGRVATPLNDGDVLTMGSYELVVEISAARPAHLAAAALAPLADGPVSHGRAEAAADLGSLLDDRGPGAVDFLDDLLGSAPLAGPGSVRRPELGDDGLLPPLGPEDLMSPLPGPPVDIGPAMKDRAPASEHHFAPPRPVATSPAIPDDWDDLIAPTAPAAPASPLPFDDSLFAPLAPPPSAPPLPFDDALFAPPPMAEPPAEPAPPPAPQTAPQTASPAPSSPFDDALFAPEPAAPTAAIPQPATAEPAPGASAAPAASAPPPPQTAPTITPPPPRAETGDAAARAFLRALDAGHLPISDAELQPTMARMGQVLKTMITGLRELLMTRTSIKSEFRINQTMISAGGNNPLKFSISPEQAIEAMVKPSTRGYLEATEAADQALHDIKAHEVAMMTGMEAALKGVLKRLDPQVLAGKIETGGGIGSILMGKKARYWEVYEKMYAEISDQAENDFHELFAREFARAYQDQLERLK